MISTLPYTPIHSMEWLESFFKKNYYKMPYSRFTWWRSYTTKTKPLTGRYPLRDRILNGDFDYSSYRYEAEVVEHRINEKFRLLRNDPGRYVEETSLDISRRKRLMEDYGKDETTKLGELKNAFLTTFKLDKDQYECELMNTELELIDFYFFIEEKYGIYWKPAKIPIN